MPPDEAAQRYQDRPTADELLRKKIDSSGDPLVEIKSHINFSVLAAEVDRMAPRPINRAGRQSAVFDGNDGAYPGVEDV